MWVNCSTAVELVCESRCAVVAKDYSGVDETHADECSLHYTVVGVCVDAQGVVAVEAPAEASFADSADFARRGEPMYDGVGTVVEPCALDLCVGWVGSFD